MHHANHSKCVIQTWQTPAAMAHWRRICFMSIMEDVICASKKIRSEAGNFARLQQSSPQVSAASCAINDGTLYGDKQV
jgi:hypothetical protein